MAGITEGPTESGGDFSHGVRCICEKREIFGVGFSLAAIVMSDALLVIGPAHSLHAKETTSW